MLRGCYIVSAYSHFNASAYEAKHQPNFNVMPSNARHLFNPSSFKTRCSLRSVRPSLIYVAPSKASICKKLKVSYNGSPLLVSC